MSDAIFNQRHLLKFNEVHICLDCEYAGPLFHTQHGSQCPQCASRAVWPVAAWSKPEYMILPFHRVPPVKVKHPCCWMSPTFLGGLIGT